MAQTKEATQEVEVFEIEFIRDYLVKDGTGKIYHKGDRVKINKASCNHFVRRDAARYVGNEPPAEKKQADVNVADMAARARSLENKKEQ